MLKISISIKYSVKSLKEGYSATAYRISKKAYDVLYKNLRLIPQNFMDLGKCLYFLFGMI